MWNAVSDKDANDPDFSKYLFHYDYVAQQTGFVQPYADSPVDNEMPYGRVPQGHPVIVDYFYHEEIRGTENTGKRNR